MKIKTYKQKQKTLYDQYLAQIDIGDDIEIIILTRKRSQRNAVLNSIKQVLNQVKL